MDRSLIGKCSHITRQLSKDGKLSSKTLEFALSIIEAQKEYPNDKLLNSIHEKLSTKQNLNDYELHIIVDVLLVHKRLNN